jgi:hypothetical protein
MNFTRYKIKNVTYQYENLAEVKQVMDEIATDYFDEINFVCDYDNNDDYNTAVSNGTAIKDTVSVVFKKDNKNIFKFTNYTNDGGENKSHGLNIYRYIYDDKYLELPSDTYNKNNGFPNSGWYANHYIMNRIFEIIKTDYGISFCIGESLYPSVFSYGCVTITKTYNNNIAVIMPSYYLYNGTGTTTGGENKTNYLQAVTNKSRGTYYDTSITWSTTYHELTSLAPVLVCGDDDYCPHVFYTLTSPFSLIDSRADSIMNFEGKLYYFNGFIALEIGSE